MILLRQQSQPKKDQDIQRMKDNLMYEMLWHAEPTAVEMYVLKKHSKD
jgi:hypothetical protein